jgi:hypothetical protein
MKFELPVDPPYPYHPQLQPDSTKEIPHTFIPSFIVITDIQLGYFIKSGNNIADILDYKKVRNIFSQEDIAKIIAFVKIITNEPIPTVPSHISHDTTVNTSEMYTTDIRTFWKMDKTELLEYINAIEPLVESLVKKIESIKTSRSIEEIANLDVKSVFSIKPIGINGHYLIVVTESFLDVLKIREVQLSIISECLKVLFHISPTLALDNESNSFLVTYLKLLLS